MKNDFANIYVGQGIGKIKFGLVEQNVISLLGYPDKIVDGDSSKNFYFNKWKLCLKFEKKRDNKLGWIEVYNKQAFLYNKKIFSLSVDKLLKLLEINLMEKPIFEDNVNFQSYFFKKKLG